MKKQQLNEYKQTLKWLEKQKALMELETNPFYDKPLEQTPLLALWKRISSHRTACNSSLNFILQLSKENDR